MAVHVLVGDDESMLRAAVTALVHELVGDGDRALMVDEHDQEDGTVSAIVDAAQTSPFLTDRRVVVARNVARFSVDELRPLVDYIADPLDTTELVVEWGSQRRPKAFNDALAAAGVSVVSTDPPSRARDRQGWLADEADRHGVRLDGRAAAALLEHLGENVSALDGIMRTLVATYGEGALLRREQIEPFLGDAGGVPPWELTDAIDNGRTEQALSLLTRMMTAGERHPLQIMAILQGHYGRLASIDGADVGTEAEAAAVMGIKPGYPARKAMELSRRLGSSAVHRAIDLLAAADLDLRGRRQLDERLVMEVLVARLSRLAR
jgi:DNA polymerase III subunit delta